MAVADGRKMFGFLIFGIDFKMPKSLVVYDEVEY